MKNTMKALMALLLISITSTAMAANGDAAPAVKKLQKVDDNSASLIVSEQDNNQAANFVDGKEMQDFIKMEEANPNSLLASVEKKLTHELGYDSDECKQTYCGSLVLLDPVSIEFGRGGWASAGASYLLYVGNIERGTGHYRSINYAVKITEQVESTNPDGGDEIQKFNKTYKIEGYRDVSKDVYSVK